MASIIRIKRSSTAGNPNTLAAGELAYSALTDNGSNGGDRLYIGIGAENSGNAANHYVIGGKYFTDMMDHSRGTLTASSAIITDADSKIDNLKVDNLDLNGNTLSSANTNGNITLDPNGTGYVQVVGTNGLIIPVGTTEQRAPNAQGAIRYNTSTSSFEGYSGSTWGSLGGVKSVDGLTYITAESAPGISDDALSFVTNGTERLFIDTDSAEYDASVIVKIDNDTQSTATNSGALVVAGGVGIAKDLRVGGNIYAVNFTGTGSVSLGNININTNTISSTNTNGDINLTPNGTGKTVITNLYIGADTITEFIQDTVGSQIVAGEGIDVTYNDGTDSLTIDAEIATISNRGVASFADANFIVTDGAVSTKNIILGTSTLTNGSTTSSLAGLTQLDVDNIRIDGNTISSTDANGNIVLAPNGTGDVQVNADTLRVGDDNVAATVTTNGTGNLTLSTNSGTNSGTIVINQGVNGNIVLDPNGTGTVDVGSARITSVAEPVNGSDAATKNYVDTIAEGLHVHEAAHCATTGTLASISGGTVTYDNGSSGIGATLTLSNGITALDGHTLTNGDRILVKDEVNQAHNGLYVRTSATVLTRTSDFDTGAEIGGGDFVFVETGTLYGATGWVQIIEVVTVGTDNVIWRQFSGSGTFTAGNGLTINGSEFNVGGTANRITVTADAVDIASTYIGQTSITTLGTITTGTWQGTVIGPTYGGTGVNNGTKTITLGGNLTTSGVFNTTFTVTAETSITLPTTGTLATLGGTETFTNKTLTSPTITGGSINNTPIGATTASTGRFTTVTITGTNASSSTTTGALVVAGGVGVGEDIYVAQDIIGAGAATSDLDGFNIDGGTY